MKVLLVNGSPRPKSCTYTALSEVAETLNKEGIETEIFQIGKKPIAGCMACMKCKETGKCVISDIVNEFGELAKSADGFVFGSPVYFASAAGAMTAFMDRAFYSPDWNIFYLKPAAAVVSARRAGTTATFDQMNKYFTICQKHLHGFQSRLPNARPWGELALELNPASQPKTSDLQRVRPNWGGEAKLGHQCCRLAPSHK